MPEIFHIPVRRNDPAPWIEGIFVGWQQPTAPYSNLLFSSREDSVAIIGPPRSGKTGALLIPAAVTWPGALISASTKTDVLRATRGRRLDWTVAAGGDVYVYSPGDRSLAIDGATTVRWSPLAGCEDPSICEERVSKVIGPKRQDQNEDDFFRQQAQIVLRGYFHAAALAGVPMRQVKRWVDFNDVSEPMEILRTKSQTVKSAEAYLSSLHGIEKQAPNTKSSTFSTVNGKLGPLINNAVVLENLDNPNFDIDDFLGTGSTLYIVSPENVQEVIAPLITGLVEAIVTRAYALASRAPRGRIDPPLLLLLDEVGAIAPLPTLPAIMAQGASQGVLCAWAAQSFNQLKAKWGQDWANSILGSSSHKIIFGGANADTELLNQLSDAFGETTVWVNPYGEGRGAKARQLAAALAKQHQNPIHTKEKVLKVSDLFKLEAGHATLIAMTPQGPQFAQVGVPHAASVHPFRQVLEAEADIQSKLQGHDHEPKHLKSAATISRIHEIIPDGELKRFKREERDLIEKLNALEALPEPTRRSCLAGDPILTRERASCLAMHALPQHEQLEAHAMIMHAFATGAIPHFTFTLVAAPPEPDGEPPARPKVHRAAGWTESR